MLIVIANYRTGSSTFFKEHVTQNSTSIFKNFSGEWFHEDNGGYQPPHPKIKEYKIIPDQFGYEENYESFKRDYLDRATRIYYTARRDFLGQVQSLGYAQLSGDWHPHNVDEETLEEAKKSKKRKVPYNRMFYNYRLLKKNLQWQKKIYDEYGGTVFYLEDRWDDSKVYKRRLSFEFADIKSNTRPSDYQEIDVNRYMQGKNDGDFNYE